MLRLDPKKSVHSVLRQPSRPSRQTACARSSYSRLKPRARDEHVYLSRLFANIPFFDKPFILLSAIRDLGKLSIHPILTHQR